MATGWRREDEETPVPPLTGGIAGGPGPTPPGFTDGTEPRPPAPGEESVGRSAGGSGPAESEGEADAGPEEDAVGGP